MKRIIRGFIITESIMFFCFAVLLVVISNDKVSAATSIEKNHNNTFLGVSTIVNPTEPSNEKAWSGSYVYYGKYDNQRIKCRVLAPTTTTYGGRTMFLDSESGLLYRRFDDNSCVWDGSEIQGFLNGEFFDESFTTNEKEAIVTSKLIGGESYISGSYESYEYRESVGVNDKIFLLDASELLNPVYGYSSYAGCVSGWRKGDREWKYDVSRSHAKICSNGYWMRSANPFGSGYVGSGGELRHSSVTNECAVAPAFNIDCNHIIFSSLIRGEVGKANSEYALTVLDNNLIIEIQNGKKVVATGSSLSIPYQIKGADADSVNRVSILILDREYKSGNTNNANILYYDELEDSYEKSGIGTFILPPTLKVYDWGTKYYVYILAEDINGYEVTDYASCPLLLNSPEITVTGKWIKEGDAWHYIDNNGSMAIGWCNVNSDWYYFDNKGIMCKGWNIVDNNWFYFGGNGVMRIDWQSINNEWYYFGFSGVMRKGWQEIDGSWYYFGSDGAMRTRWESINGEWYYFGNNGIMRNGWQLVDGSWYFFGNNGVMRKDWTEIDSCWYYFGGNGKMRTHWEELNGYWYYFGTDGSMRKGWQDIFGSRYYFGDNGIMYKGWQIVDRQLYFFKQDGSVAINEFVDGNCFDANGKWTSPMGTRWMKDSKGWWYGDSHGWYAKNCTVKIDGKEYSFDSSGYCINP